MHARIVWRKLVSRFFFKKIEESFGFFLTSVWKIPIRASVVVTPQAILHQWVDEIKKHAPSLKVLVYEGVSKVQKVLTEQVSKQKKGACPIIACHQLSQFDIILVSYQTLRAEQGHVEIKQRGGNVFDCVVFVFGMKKRKQFCAILLAFLEFHVRFCMVILRVFVWMRLRWLVEVELFIRLF